MVMDNGASSKKVKGQQDEKEKVKGQGDENKKWTTSWPTSAT